jgi:hypothetical protein
MIGTYKFVNNIFFQLTDKQNGAELVLIPGTSA